MRQRACASRLYLAFQVRRRSRISRFATSRCYHSQIDLLQATSPKSIDFVQLVAAAVATGDHRTNINIHHHHHHHQQQHCHSPPPPPPPPPSAMSYATNESYSIQHQLHQQHQPYHHHHHHNQHQQQERTSNLHQEQHNHLSAGDGGSHYQQQQSQQHLDKLNAAQQVLAALYPMCETSSATLTSARLVLVILICVLLFKLRSTNPKSRQSIIERQRRLSDSSLSSISSTSSSLSSTSTLSKSSSSSSIYSSYLPSAQPSIAHLKLPPGPRGLPFLGYLPFISNEIHLTLTSLSERYGPIYQIYLGGIRVVVLNDVALVRQAFKQPVFSGRPDTQLTRILQGYGIVNSEGALWKEQRSFLHSALRKLGAKSLMSGANGLEAKIQNQVKEFVNDLRVHANEGKPCQVRPMVARAVSSVVGSIIMNLTYRKYEEKEKFDRLIELMQEGFRLFTIAMPLDFIPIFRFLPGVSYAYSKMKKNRAETSAFFQGVADEHRKYLSETFNLGASSAASSLHPHSDSGKATRSSFESSSNIAATAAATANAANASNVNLSAATGAQKARPQQQAASSVTAAALSSEASSSSSQQSSSCQSTNNNKSGDQTSDNINIIINNNNNSEQHAELDNIVARDLVDAYILQQKKHEKDGKKNYFSDQQLVQIMSDIFSAGLETVTSTIEWSILFLILNPHCQDQIQEEIDRVIGRDRSPQLEDLSHMPYTEATIYEVLRRSNVVALGNAHATLDDATIGGYRIPKGTQVLPNLYGIHMSPKLWQKPENFDPSRFIVQERAQKPDYFIPFSVGRRMCLGDVLAKMEVFLFLVGLLQKYDLSVAEEDRHCPPQVKGTIGVSNTPASFRVALSYYKNKNNTTTNNNSESSDVLSSPASQATTCQL